jgi:pimeloyl-ACP methyl ester carboxylesterase
VWPAYVAELGKLSGFGDFMKENDRLRAEAQKSARLEYFVDKPAHCTPARRCPLVLILHGGVGSHAALAESWHSARLASDFIVVRTQGAECRGSFSRAYEDDGLAGILAVYRQVLDRYPVDTSRTVLAGQSNGGRAAILLATTGKIAAQGLILAFPTKPRELDEQEVRRAARRGLRAVLLCGEKDWAIEQQRELAALFDRSAVPNTFLVFATKGHEFPEGFPAHIDRSLEFVLGLPLTTTSDGGRR